MPNPQHPLDAHTIPTLPPTFHYIPSFLTRTEESHLLTHIHSGRVGWINLSKRRLQVYPAQLTSKNVLLSKDPLPPWLLEPLQAKFDALGVFEGVGEDAREDGGENEGKDGGKDGGSGGSGGNGGRVEMNHVLINNYKPGEGIMPHEDGPAYWPVTATVSLGSHTVLEVTEKLGPESTESTEGSTEGSTDGTTGQPDGGSEGRKWRILQEPRSLLVTRGKAYGGTMHGIREVEVDELSEGSVANWGLLGEKGGCEGKVRRGERTSLTCRSVRKVSRLGGRLLGR